MDSLEKSLSLEQKLNHRLFCDRIKELNLEQAQQLLIQMHKQNLYKDNIYKELIIDREQDIVDLLFGAKK